MIAQHSSKSDDWGTPAEWIKRVHSVLGEIDLDPASSAKHNKIVGAKRYYTEKENGLTQCWAGRVFLNPPGGRGVPKAFLEKLCRDYRSCEVDAAIYLGYSLEQLRWLQPLCLEGYWVAVPNRIIKFLGAGDSPTHANFFLLLAPYRYIEPFRKAFQNDCLLLTTAEGTLT